MNRPPKNAQAAFAGGSRTAFNSFYAHRYLLGYILFFTLAVLCIAFAAGGRVTELAQAFYLAAGGFFSLMFLYLIPLVRAFWRAVSGARPILRIAFVRDVLEGFESEIARDVRAGRYWDSLAGLVAMALLIFAFSVAKSIIPHLTPYHLDPPLAALDRFVHFGVYPHDLLNDLVRFAGGDLNALAVFLDNVYAGWFFMLLLLYGCALFADRDNIRRMRILWSVTLLWTLPGFLGALACASVGPVFYHLFYDHPSPYLALKTFLDGVNASAPLFTVQAGPALYNDVTDDAVIGLNALSAMPSMHVALAWLSVIYAWHLDRRLWAAALLYAALIFAGSVALGWHYAVDGYAAIILTWLIWRFSAWIARAPGPGLCCHR